MKAWCGSTGKPAGRYRNRMEFKVGTAVVAGLGYAVDIETEWNLKLKTAQIREYGALVDIETEWNLKSIKTMKTVQKL